MWKGRFKTATAELLQRYSESISFDWRLYPYDVQGSIAQAAALAAAGLITEEERASIEQGLLDIRGEIERGEFQFREELEDIHMNIEAELTRRIGAAGAKLHTARSRNDQVALDIRLYLRGRNPGNPGPPARPAKRPRRAGRGECRHHPARLHPSSTGATGAVCAPDPRLCGNAGARLCPAGRWLQAHQRDARWAPARLPAPPST
ncbi:MAG: lyase family protein [Chthoniobacteraceae bacterium]